MSKTGANCPRDMEVITEPNRSAAATWLKNSIERATLDDFTRAPRVFVIEKEVLNSESWESEAGIERVL